MKRRGKLILLSLSVIVLLIIIFNFNEIKFGLNMAKSYKNDSQENNQELTQNEEKLLSGENNPLIIILKKEDFSLNKDDKTKEKEDNKIDKSDSKKTEGNNGRENEYKETISKYNSEFSSLQSEFEAKLSGLLSEGYNEYQSGISAGKLAPKYLKKGANLEAECDSKFYTMLDNLESELKSSNEDTSIVNDLKKYYDSYKDAKRGEIMNKASGHL